MKLSGVLSRLIAFESVTPQDAGCQQFMMDWFTKLGFECTVYNNPPVHNFFARLGTQAPLLVFAGHTDVVPAGDLNAWDTPPYTLVEKNGQGFGRGVADMKGSLAAMMKMAEHFVHHHTEFNGSLGFLITSGEEGDLYDQGTPHVMKALYDQGVHIDYCIVGEPSSTAQVGDVIKIGRRGSLSAKISVYGKQGHVAYPHLAENPIHTFSKALVELTEQQWDQGNAYFPPTTMQVTHIQSGGDAGNIIPGNLSVTFNLRYSTEHTSESLKTIVEECLNRHQLKTDIIWRLSGEPFLTAQGKLLESAIESVKTLTNHRPTLCTSGGTSDGRFIAPYGVEVIELGLVNQTIHQVNECIVMQDLNLLTELYKDIVNRLLLTHLR